MVDIQIAWNLSGAWRHAVRGRKIAFELTLDDAITDVGRPGDTIVCGVKPTGKRCEFFARNNTTGDEIPNPVIEERIPDSEFVMQFNRSRFWRPGTRARQPGRQAEISPAWESCRFDCQVPTGPNSRNSLLVRDPLVQVKLQHWHWNAYYNAVPFEAEGHFIWVPVRQEGTTTMMPHYTQRLTREFLADVLELSRISSDMTIFFNSLHAGASVNHIHVQSVASPCKLAIEIAIERSSLSWQGSVAVLADYPVGALVFRKSCSVDELFPFVHRLHSSDPPIPFNLVLLGDWICLVPRNLDCEVIPEIPNGVLGSMEMVGKLVFTDERPYQFAHNDPEGFFVAYGKVGLSVVEIETLFELAAT